MKGTKRTMKITSTDELSLTLGARHDRYSTVGSRTTPRAAIVYHPSPGSAVKLLVGNAFRTASVYELTYEEPGEAKPNPQLDPERIRTLELVWEHRLSAAIQATASVYDYRMEDLIEQTFDPDDQLSYFGNVNAVDARGLELGVALRRASGLHGYASYSLQSAEDADSGLRLTNYPTHLAKGGLSGPLTRHLTGAVALRYESGRCMVFGSLTEGHLLTDVRLRLRPALETLNVSLAVDNLFDVDHSIPGSLSHRQVVIPQDGRRFLLRVQRTL